MITNGSLLFREDVRRDIAPADVVLPSLDAGGDAVFERINRPHPALSFAQLVEGLKAFRRGYKGKIWLEIMLIKGINNGMEDMDIFKQIVSGISADKVQLNTVARPPLEEAARGLDGAELLSLADFLGNGCEIIPAFERRSPAQKAKQWRESVVETLRRRSLSLDDVVRTTGVSPTEAKAGLDKLIEQGKIRLVRFNNEWFYVAGREENLS